MIARDEAVLRLIRESLYTDINGQDGTEVSSNWIQEVSDWSAVYEEMKAQTLLSLPLGWLSSHTLPDAALQEKWLKEAKKQQYLWLKKMMRQQELFALLEKNQIPVVILKGSAAAVYYPEPSVRMSGDIDFLVKNRDFEAAKALLLEQGYTLTHDESAASHHLTFHQDNVCFELHKRPGIVPESNQELIRLFEDGIEKRAQAKIGSFTFPMLPPRENGLILLFHIDQHLRTGIGLRQILDWMLYVEQEADDAFYESELQPVLEEYGLTTFAVTVTAMCKQYLGLKKDIHWCDSADPELCCDLMVYICKNGNFGRKSGFQGRVARFVQDTGNPIRLFKRLQKGGIIRWQSAKKYKVLRPFAWVYQIIYIFREISTQQSDRKIQRGTLEGQEQRCMIHRLGLKTERLLNNSYFH